MAQATANGYQAITASKGATRAPPMGVAVRRLGFWSAIAMAATYFTFVLGSSYALGQFLTMPWDQIIPIGASFLLAPSFVLLMVSIYYASPEAKRVWGHAAIAFAILYARGTWLRQRGEIRAGPHKPWMPFTAEQRYDALELEFRWSAKARMARIIPAIVTDAYENGHGRFEVRVLGLAVQRMPAGKETDAGEFLRFIAELP